MDIAIMIEGQNGLTWDRWRRLTDAAERLGFAGLYRSDHFTNGSPPDLASLECWTSLTWLASNSQRIEFGPLVSPVSFRHPTMLARFAGSVDDLSGGRLRLGLGAGWQEREHRNYSWDLLDVKSRMDRFSEALEIICGLLRSAEPVEFNGRYYQVSEAVLLPRPKRQSGPPIVIGGNGIKRTLPLVAQFADEWNAVFLTSEDFLERSRLLDGLLEARGRSPSAVQRTLMTGCYFAFSETEIQAYSARRGASVEALRARGLVVGTAADFKAQLDGLSRAGVQRVMLQWIDLDDLDRLEAMAEVLR